MEPIIPDAAFDPAVTTASVRKGQALVLAMLSAGVAIVSCLAILQSFPLQSLPSGAPSLQFVHIDEDLCGQGGCGFATPRPIPPREANPRKPTSSSLLTPIGIPIDPNTKADRLFPPLYWGGYGFGFGGAY